MANKAEPTALVDIGSFAIHNSETTPFVVPERNEVLFYVDNNILLKLTEAGFVYNGQIIEDAGVARDVFLKTMDRMAGHNA